MKYHSPIGGLNRLTKLCGGLHVLRILLLIPLTILLHLRRAAAAVLLGLTLLIDLIANLLARRFDLADDIAAVLESVADLLIQATLLCVLVPRIPELGLALVALLAKLTLALVPDWIAMRRNRSARLCGGTEKALCWFGCALLLIPLVRPIQSTALAWTLAIALSIMNLAAIPLRADCIRRS